MTSWGSVREVASFADILFYPNVSGVAKWFTALSLPPATSGVCIDQDKWNDPAWLTRLDVVFAGLYLGALAQTPPKCWQVLFDARHDTRLARIQFALAGMNAHIDHDLTLAVDTTCREFGMEPVHLSPQYQDYDQVNDLLDGIVEEAKKELLVGLLGDAPPSIGLVENMMAMWGLRATREAAWTNAELLWHAQSVPGLADRLMRGLDDATALAGRGLLAPVGI